jgi:hypothetical protein
MAITPRTIFTNPASAALTAASLFAMTAAGMYAFTTCQSSCSYQEVEPVQVQELTSTCDFVRDSLAASQATWSEADWFKYASCYDEQGNSKRVVEVSTRGLRYHPGSEALYHMKGYHQIGRKQYTPAVPTLEDGMRRVGAPSSGTMANNLAWAGLWAPREMTRERARRLYKLSLRYEPNVCETLHTGLWVEYAMAKENTGLVRAEAMRNFNALKRHYTACTDRYMSGKWDSLIEVLGAAVVIQDLDNELNRDSNYVVRNCNKKTKLIEKVSKELRKRYRGASIDALCRESVPVASAHHTCVNIIDKTVTELRNNRIIFTN